MHAHAEQGPAYRDPEALMVHPLTFGYRRPGSDLLPPGLEPPRARRALVLSTSAKRRRTPRPTAPRCSFRAPATRRWTSRGRHRPRRPTTRPIPASPSS